MKLENCGKVFLLAVTFLTISEVFPPIPHISTFNTKEHISSLSDSVTFNIIRFHRSLPPSFLYCYSLGWLNSAGFCPGCHQPYLPAQIAGALFFMIFISISKAVSPPPGLLLSKLNHSLSFSNSWNHLRTYFHLSGHLLNAL